MTRIAVIGADGQVGRQLAAAAHVARLDLIPISRRSSDPVHRADLGDPASMESAIRLAEPTHVVLAAAITNVAECEANPAAAWAINVEGTALVEEVSQSIGARLVFLSTDYVFDGLAGPYDEEATPNPINAYGRQKAAAERLVLARDGNLVVRTCQVFGPDPRRKNFVLRVADQLETGSVVEAESDLLGTPTYSVDLAGSILALIGNGAKGTWHVAGDQWLSRFDLARLVAQVAGRGHALVVAVEAGGSVPRPRRSGLVSIRRSPIPLPLTPLQTAIWSVTHGSPAGVVEP